MHPVAETRKVFEFNRIVQNLIEDEGSLIIIQDGDQDHSASWVSRLISVNFPGPNFFKFYKKRHVNISKKLTKG